MALFSSLDLQKRTGEIQIAAAREPVVITHHGKPRAVMLSVDEYIRLKERAGEPVPTEVRAKRAVTVRLDDDPLGYDVSTSARPPAAWPRMRCRAGQQRQ